MPPLQSATTFYVVVEYGYKYSLIWSESCRILRNIKLACDKQIPYAESKIMGLELLTFNYVAVGPIANKMSRCESSCDELAVLGG